MKILVLLTTIYLTFMLSCNRKIISIIVEKAKRINKKVLQFNLHLWFGIILLIGLIGLNNFNLTIPKEKIPISDIVLIILFLVPFMLNSGYKPEANTRGIITFCLIFPIGEEILFRGIILSLLTYVVGSSAIYIPVPILKAVTLQVFISAILFGITHFQYFGFKINRETLKKVWFAFVFGLLAGNLVEITGSILYPIIFHVIANSGATYRHTGLELNPK